MSRALLITAAALAAFFLAGCVGSEPRLSHQEYEREMQAIARDMNSEAAGMLANISSEEDFAEVFRRMGDLMREAADRVGDINPPEEIDEPHGKLADALDEAADILDRTIEQMDDGDFLGAMAALEEVPADLDQDVREAIQEIRTAGYYIGDSDDWG
jgi:hypothetical protein